MSIQAINSQISSLDREIINLQTQIHSLDRNIMAKSKEANSYLERISREKDLRRIMNLQKEYNRKQEEIHRIEKDKISKNKMLSDKLKRKGDLNVQLSKQEQSQREKAKKEHSELLQLQSRVTNEINRQKSFSKYWVNNLPIHSINKPNTKQYDVFISHASEDKEGFVRPLAEALAKLGVVVWYDENEIKFGNSIRKAIDNGLSNSRYVY